MQGLWMAMKGPKAMKTVHKLKAAHLRQLAADPLRKSYKWILIDP